MSRPASHRRAAVPFTYKFNKIVAVDLFFLNRTEQEVPVSTIDHGTNDQWCGRLANLILEVMVEVRARMRALGLCPTRDPSGRYQTVGV